MPTAAIVNCPTILSGTGMNDYTFKEKARIVAGAVTAVVIVGWLVIIVLAVLAAG